MPSRRYRYARSPSLPLVAVTVVPFMAYAPVDVGGPSGDRSRRSARTSQTGLGVELRSESRDVRLRTEAPDRAELVCIDVDARLLRAVHCLDERLNSDPSFGSGQVHAAGQLPSLQDQLLRLESASVADVRDLPGLPRQPLGLVRARDHLVAARHDNVQVGMRAQHVLGGGQSRRGEVATRRRRNDVDVLVRLDDRVQAGLPSNLERQGRQTRQPEHLAWVVVLARLDDTLTEQLPVWIEAEAREDDLTRDLDLDLPDVRPAGHEGAPHLHALLDRLLDRRRQRAAVVRPDEPGLVLLR